MGRESLCHADWHGGSGEVKALLETHDLILRGDVRRTLTVAALHDVVVDGDTLRFAHADEQFSLRLGSGTAASWAKKIATPPPTLAAKLGIAAATRVKLVGETSDDELTAALAQAPPAGSDVDLTVAEVADAATLDAAIAAAGDTPLWLAYAKGEASPYGEAAVRGAMRAHGWIDVKVASVSARLTATKFVGLGGNARRQAIALRCPRRAGVERHEGLPAER